MTQKHHFLKKVPGTDEQVSEVLEAITLEDPENMDFKLKNIQHKFEKESVWKALTDFMRFEAEVASRVQASKAKIQNDTQARNRMNQLQSDLEQLKLLVQVKLQKAQSESKSKEVFNQFKIAGTNLNGSLGIGTEDSQSPEDSIFRLEQFNQRKIFEIAVGDFHTLVVASGCNCVDPLNDACLGKDKCSGGADLYAWGFNIHGQCDGAPSEEPVLVPRIVPFFSINRMKISKIAARRSRSLAVTESNEVYEWGFVGSENEQFTKICELPMKCLQVEIGLEFNLFLLEDGSVHMSGAITQEGYNVLNTFGKLINLSDRMDNPVSFKQIQSGYSHALLVDESDKIYSFGANLYGQLGIGVDQDKAKAPVPVQDVNDGDDPILMISCGAHFSICYTSLGILYYWGMLVPEDTASIQWIPNFMSISMPHEISEIELLSFQIVDIKATFREVLACDSQGRIYHCDLNYSQTLKCYTKEMQRVVGSAHQVKLGRSSHLFFQNGFSPQFCKIKEAPEELQTLEENLVTVQLCNEQGLCCFLDPSLYSEAGSFAAKFPITIILNDSPDPI